MSRAYASHASPPARPPTPRPARPPAQHVAETRYRDSSRPPVRNRSTCGWGYGVRESRARPSFPVSIRYTRDGVAIPVNHGSRLIGPPEEYLIFGSDPAVLSSSILPCIQHLRNSPRSMIFSLRYNALVISRTLYNISVNCNLRRYCAD